MPEIIKHPNPQNYEGCGRPKNGGVNSHCLFTVLHHLQVVLLYIIPLIQSNASNMTFVPGG